MVKPRWNHGFTLIELMVAVAIVGILVAIAYPAYRNYIVESNRSDAQEALTRAAGMEETWYMSHNAYAGNNDISQLGGATSPQGFYTIQISNKNCALASGNGYTCFTATATPTSKDGQNQDTGCEDFTIDENGARGDSGTLPASKCWSK